ncbi:MAG TPA: tetratricopeptide repeat protein [Rhodanobacteraceae bacterium]|nr:tetratricopeptide repeat protein [Rhodanobacteraceae bacterium]
MSFVAELKQRKVFRVATVYLVVAWVAVQAASIALPAFDAPAWVLRVVILLVALGFPFALVLAWALDLTADGVRFSAGGAGTKRIAVIAALLVVLALAWYFRGQPALRFSDTTGTTAVVTNNAPAVEAETAAARSIAVLPFVNMSNDPANDYFSDGLAETTLDMLAQVPNLKVVARTSSFAFKGQALDVRKIGAALGAATLLEGSVQRSGSAVRITAQLVKTSDGTHLWSNHFDRQLADVFKIQDEVATEVVRALQVSLPVDDRQRLTQKRTENVDAYQEYLKGIALLPNRKVDDMREAARRFERAIQIDPTYARAYVALADTRQLLGEYAGSDGHDQAQIAGYIDRALALAPDLGEAHASRATLSQAQGDFAAAEREFQRAIELAPSYATGFQWYGELLGYELHEYARAEQMMRRAVALDPLSPIVQDQLIGSLIGAGRLDDARTELAKLQREHPDFAASRLTQARLALARGDLVETLRSMRELAKLDPAALQTSRNACYFMQRFGALDAALRCLDDFAQRSPELEEGAREDRADLINLRDGPAAALAELARAKTPHPAMQAYLLLCLDRNDEALALLRPLLPSLFADAPPDLYPAQIGAALLVSVAQMRTGAVDRGHALLRKVVALVAAHPGSRHAWQNAWWEAIAYALLGDNDKAMASLQDGVAAGTVLDIDGLDRIPLLKGLRADPRYEKTIAPARARAAAQVKAAHDAGLL